MVVPLAKRESAAYVKAFNDRKFKDLAPLFTSDAEIAFLQGSSVEKLEYGMVDGREEIVSCHETFCSIVPGRQAHADRPLRPAGPAGPAHRRRGLRDQGVTQGRRPDPGPGRGRPRAGVRGLEDRRRAELLQDPRDQFQPPAFK